MLINVIYCLILILYLHYNTKHLLDIQVVVTENDSIFELWLRTCEKVCMANYSVSNAISLLSIPDHNDRYLNFVVKGRHFVDKEDYYIFRIIPLYRQLKYQTKYIDMI